MPMLEVAPGLTLLWGGNGSGKTSLLEAIFLLGRGRSFRTRNTERLIRTGQDHLRVVGQVSSGDYSQTIGFEARASGVTARVSGRTVTSLAELSQVFAVQVIEPGVHKLLEEGGHRRRRWMDWAVFHVEPQFVETWLRYTRALKQRNAALRTQPEQATAWDTELVRAGEVDRRIPPELSRTAAALLAGDSRCAQRARRCSFTTCADGAPDRTLAEALVASRARDELRRLTHSGPHRADVAVRLDGRPAREVLSRGQQKLVAVAMTVAQLRLLQAAHEHHSDAAAG